jgi:hypothetical protein
MNQIKENSDDWAIQIKQTISKQDKIFVENIYNKNELMSQMAVAEGYFEDKNIWFKYRFFDDEKRCNLYISDKRINMYRFDEKNNIVIFKWKISKYAGRFPVLLDIIADKIEENKKYYLQIDVLSKFDKGNYKSNNKDNFYNMLDDILDAYINPYKLLNPSRIPENKEKYKYPISLRQFFYIHENNSIDKLEPIIRQIILDPYREYIRVIDIGNPDIIDNNVIHDMINQKVNLIKVRNSFLSQEIKDIFIKKGIDQISSKIHVYKNIENYNVFPNQLIKTTLSKMIKCTVDAEYIFIDERQELEEMKQNIKEDNDEDGLEKLATKDRQIKEIDRYISKCKEYRMRLSYMKNYSFFDDIQETFELSGFSSLFQDDINYNRFYNIFRRFMIMPKFHSSNNLGLTILDMPTTYEYWTLIKMINILRKKLVESEWKITENNIIKNYRKGRLIRFPYGKLIEFTKGNMKISLYYHERYITYMTESFKKITGKFSHYLKPDISIEATIDKKLFKGCVLIIDPKYRTNLLSGGGDNPESAINKMGVNKIFIIGHANQDLLIIDYDEQIVGSSISVYIGPTIIDPMVRTGGINLLPRKEETDIVEIDNIIQIYLDRINYRNKK